MGGPGGASLIRGQCRSWLGLENLDFLAWEGRRHVLVRELVRKVPGQLRERKPHHQHDFRSRRTVPPSPTSATVETRDAAGRPAGLRSLPA